MRPASKFGIRERLFLAFGSVAALTVIASTVAWFSFGKLSDNLDQIVAINIPAVTLAARLAETGAVISATAPALIAAEDEPARERTWKALSESLKATEALLLELDPDLVGKKVKKSLRSIVDLVAINLRELDTNVRRHFWFNTQNEDLTERLRWAHADFLEEIEPMVEDSRFTIEVELETTSATAPRVKQLRQEMAQQQALLRLNATGNLTIGLIARAANAATLVSLDDTVLFLRDVTSGIGNDMAIVRGIPGSLSLQQALEDMLAFSDGDNSLIQLRRDELINHAKGRELLEVNLELVSRLQKLINQRVESGHRATIAATEASRDSTRSEKLLLFGVAAISLVVALLVVWLYVGRNLVRRITLLDTAMGSIAEGDLETRVPTGGSDEISDMATSLRTFRDTLVETQAELVQAGKLAALGQLSAGVAHELTQPLAAIRSYAHNSRRLIEKHKIGKATESLGKISGLIERMSATISHLHTLARRPLSTQESVNLHEVSNNALQLLDTRLREGEVVVTNRFPDQPVYVHAEAIRLEQVLINLFSNAIDATAGSNPRELELSQSSENDKVTMRIKDNGCGISEKNLPHVFDPFFTTKGVGDGLGLGLSISYNIIKDFKGIMTVKSQDSVGTTFSIVLDKG